MADRPIAALLPRGIGGVAARHAAIEAAAAAVGREVRFFEADETGDYRPVFDAVQRTGATSIIFSADTQFNRDIALLSHLALKMGIGTICHWREMVQEGCLKELRRKHPRNIRAQRRLPSSHLERHETHRSTYRGASSVRACDQSPEQPKPSASRSRLRSLLALMRSLNEAEGLHPALEQRSSCLAARVLAQSGKSWRIGFIAHRYERFYDALFEGLRDLDYREGQNVIVERRYAEGRVERFREFAAEMVRLKVDVIIVVTTPAALAAKNATTAIPIVHPAAIDPVGTGLIASLAHPGGNVTGLAVLNAELSAKRLEVLKELLPGLSQGAVLWNSGNPANALDWKETEDAARALGITIQSYAVRDFKEFESAFDTMAQQRPGALLTLQDALTLQFRKEIIDFALRARLPSMFVGRSGSRRAV